MPVPQWNADIITPDNEASAEIISGGGLVKDETGAVGVSVDGETVVINNEGALQAIGGGIPYNVFKCRYSAGTAPTATTVIAKWKDTESSDNIWYVVCFNKASALFSNDTGLVEVMNATIQLPLFETVNMFNGCTALTRVPLFDLSSTANTYNMFNGCTAVETGALALYQQVSSQSNPPSSHTGMFTNCGSGTTTGAAELAQIPTDWGGTMA